MKYFCIKHFVALCFLLFGGFYGGLFAQTHPALGGGIGTSTDPYQIKTSAHLKSLADFVNGGAANGDATAGVYYIVINDLDLNAYTASEGWNPIGYYTSSTDNSYFKGNFNGNGKKVTNLKINRPTKDYQGLFGYTSSADIKNLGIENCDIAGRGYVGGLAGENKSSTISNCYATGTISGSSDVGGLAGISSSSISNCYAAGKVSGTSYVGGLAGENSSSPISNCYATAKVSGGSYVGGLVGRNYSPISNCYATGKVNGATSVGGLVGGTINANIISNCYATGNVSGTGNDVSGLVGSSSTTTGLDISLPTIKNCIAANDSVVSTANTVYIYRIGSCKFFNNYALSTMVVKNSSGNVPITNDSLKGQGGMSKSMSDFQNLYFYSTAGNWNTAAWDINDPSGVWQICPYDGMLPFLRWQNFICFVPVDEITGLPATVSAGVPLTLTGTVSPSDATNQTITWSVKNAGTTGAAISGNTLNTTAAGTATLTAIVVNGLTKTTDYKQDFVVTVVPVAVTNISGIPTTAQINTMLTLSGTVEPSNATNKTIVWSLIDAGTTHAVLSGNTFFASAAGVAFLSATIKDGVAIGTDYEKQFTITVSTVGIEQLTMNNEQLTIYPNPTTGQLIINCEDKGACPLVKVYNVVGQVVFTSQLSELSPETTINISHLANGLYFLKVGGKMFKIIKE